MLRVTGLSILISAVLSVALAVVGVRELRGDGTQVILTLMAWAALVVLALVAGAMGAWASSERAPTEVLVFFVFLAHLPTAIGSASWLLKRSSYLLEPQFNESFFCIAVAAIGIVAGPLAVIIKRSRVQVDGLSRRDLLRHHPYRILGLSLYWVAPVVVLLADVSFRV